MLIAAALAILPAWQRDWVTLAIAMVAMAMLAILVLITTPKPEH
jgi:hypothetical protein